MAMLNNVLNRQLTKTLVNIERKQEEKIIISSLPESLRTPLTESEKKAVDEKWSKITGGGYKLSYKELEVFKHFNGFDSRYLSHNLYLPLVSRRLNNYHYTKFFEDKGLLGHLSTSITFPYCIIRCVNGEYYDNSFRQISKDKAKEYLGNHKGKIVFKIARESSGGHGVRMIDTAFDKDAKQRVFQLMDTFGTDYVVQEAICQHETMAKFNRTSVNTLRINTLYLNGKISLCGTVLRIGKDGSFVDNMSSGGMGIGVDGTGHLNEYGYDYGCNQLYEMNGVRFAGEKIDFVPDIVDHILKAHEKDFSFCKFIGWDVCINQDGKPIVIEINASQPGIFGEQLNFGPIFGDRTEEVIDYVSGKEFQYGRGLLNI